MFVRACWIMAVAGAVLLPLASAQPQPNKAGANKAEPAKGLTRSLVGIESCVRCHVEPPKDIKSPDLSRCIEVPIWKAEDKHKDANKVLAGERGRHIGKVLRIDDVTTHPSCISCHGTALLNVDQREQEIQIIKSEGVTCVVCHGPHEEWIDPHGSSSPKKRKEWRSLSRADKESQWGMTDLWDPEKRATLCLSCHLGNPAQGKFVTHEMYAAGHPPLPSIEVASFCDQMPRHWQYLAEKSPAVQQLLQYDPARSPLERSELAVVSAVVALRQSMHILEGFAKEPEGWPEFAVYDCYACHHELKTPSWRQARGFAGIPGRPQARQWPGALATLGIQGLPQQAGLAAQHDELTKDLVAAFNVRPFGDPRKVQTAAQKLAAWSDEVLRGLKKQSFDKALAEKLLHQLTATVDGKLLDFDSARQLAWAYAAIDGELTNRQETPKEVRQRLAKMDETLKLQLVLPYGQVSIVGTEHAKTGKSYLQETLDALKEYDPFRFRRDFPRKVQPK